MISRYFNQSLKQHLLILTISIFAVFTLFPFAIMILYSGKSYAQILTNFWAMPNPILWQNYLFGMEVTGRYILNSIIVSTGVLFITIIISSLAAYAFSQINFFGRKATHSAILSLLFIPSTLTLIPLFTTVRDLGLLNSYSGLILPQVATSLPMAVFLLKAFFDELPQDLYNAAKIDGANELQTLRHLVIPLSLPVFSTLIVLNILSSWNNYIWVLLSVRDAALRTLPLGLNIIKVEANLLYDPGKLMAAYFIASLPMLIVFLIALKPFMKGMTAGAIKF